MSKRKKGKLLQFPIVKADWKKRFIVKIEKKGEFLVDIRPISTRQSETAYWIVINDQIAYAGMTFSLPEAMEKIEKVRASKLATVTEINVEQQ